MELDELLAEVSAFGVEGHQALAYYHLARLGASTASEIARAADLPRTDVYRLMDELEEDGLVERTLSSPTRFSPVPIDEALDRLLAQRARRSRELDKKRDELVQAWPRPEGRTAPDEERVSIKKGRQQVEGLLNRLVDDAGDHVLIACPKRSLARFESMNVLAALTDRVKDGLEAKVLTEVDETNLDTATRWSHAAEVRHLDLPAYWQLVIQDASTIALFVAVDPLTSVSGSGLTAIKLTSQDFILGQEALFDSLWDQALSLEARVRELETSHPAPQARIVRGRWPKYEKMDELLHRAQAELRFALCGMSLEHPRAEQFLDRIRHLAKEGLNVRILDADDAVDALGGSRREIETWPHPALLIADEREVFRVLSSGDASDSWSLWSTLEGDVSREIARFDDAWDEAA